MVDDTLMPRSPSYWLDLFTYKSWNEFLEAGGAVSGFSEGRRAMVQKMREGDLLLCYLTGVSRFVARVLPPPSPRRSTSVSARRSEPLGARSGTWLTAARPAAASVQRALSSSVTNRDGRASMSSLTGSGRQSSGGAGHCKPAISDAGVRCSSRR
jgi:hypothetical protein